MSAPFSAFNKARVDLLNIQKKAEDQVKVRTNLLKKLQAVRAAQVAKKSIRDVSSSGYSRGTPYTNWGFKVPPEYGDDIRPVSTNPKKIINVDITNLLELFARYKNDSSLTIPQQKQLIDLVKKFITNPSIEDSLAIRMYRLQDNDKDMMVNIDEIGETKFDFRNITRYTATLWLHIGNVFEDLENLKVIINKFLIITGEKTIVLNISSERDATHFTYKNFVYCMKKQNEILQSIIKRFISMDLSTIIDTLKNRRAATALIAGPNNFEEQIDRFSETIKNLINAVDTNILKSNKILEIFELQLDRIEQSIPNDSTQDIYDQLITDNSNTLKEIIHVIDAFYKWIIYFIGIYDIDESRNLYKGIAGKMINIKNYIKEFKNIIDTIYDRQQYLLGKVPGIPKKQTIKRLTGGRRNTAKKPTAKKPTKLNRGADMNMKDIRGLCKVNQIKLSKTKDGVRVIYTKKELITKLKRKKIL